MNETKSERRPIRVLPRELAEKIAAGEVVERPSSVIKELVENSLDANAKVIRVELEEGGRKRLSVIDDGHGIPPEEMPIALERHATSKIDELDDLWNLRTMGFRGEALPSVAAVSRFTLESRTLRSDGVNGRRLYLEGGRQVRDQSLDPTSPLQDRPTGTLIIVEDLFFNVPARLKFLKSKSGESANIRELIERIALCNPAVGFTLISEGRKSLQLEAAHPSKRVADILETSPENIETFESQFEDITVRGWLDRDSRASNSRYIYLAVNGRMVRDKLLQQAVLVGLRPRMMEGEYPKIYLEVEVPPADVDVNVHPAKSEVRFRRSRDVFQVVHGALERLAKKPTQNYYSSPLNIEPEPEPKQSRIFETERTTYKTKEYYSAPSEPSAPIEPSIGRESPAPLDFQPKAQYHPDHLNHPVHPIQKKSFTTLHYIGQLKNTYLLFQDDGGLVLIDQHAAHERINYEKIKAEFLATGLQPQPLLLSAVVKCSPEKLNLALENSGAFTKLGFEFEAFGENSLVIRSAPLGIESERSAELFRSLLEELSSSDAPEILAKDPSRLSAKTERMLATSACHSSVRAGQSLSAHEARELAAQMEETESSLNCPHGRPASIRLTYSQIEGLFKR